MEEARRGFRILDLMVAVAILGILFAWLSPFLLHNNDAARRSQCVNNLKQLGLALHNYNAAYDCLPPAGESGSGIGCVAGPQNFSMKARLLPFMELTNIFNSINFSVSAAWNNASTQSTVDGQFINATARGARILSFVCPSDVNQGSPSPSPTWPATSYAENRGLGRYYHHWDATGIAYFPGCDPHLNQAVTFARITDGLSQTAAFSEVVKGKGLMNQDGLHMVYAGNVAAFAYDQPDGDLQTARMCQASSTFRWDYKGEMWLTSDSGRGGGYFHIQTPNRKACAGPAKFDSVIGASSYHKGGVNLLLMDGAVKFARNGIAPGVWRGLGTINQGDDRFPIDFNN